MRRYFPERFTSMHSSNLKVTRMRRFAIARGVLLAGAVLLPWACTENRDRNDAPAPGEMQVISVTPLQSGAVHSNLLPNGSFSEWWAGAPAPTGFQAPDSELSIIERATDRRTTGFTVRQRWLKPDRRERNTRCFQTELNLKPETQYTLQIAATTNDEHRSPQIFVLERKADGGYEVLAVPLLALEAYPGLYRWYEATFVTKRGARAVILAKTLGEDEKQDVPTVIWHAWQLYETSNAPALPAESERPAIFGVSAPKVPDGGTITLAAGENLEITGWIVGGADAIVQFQLEGGEWHTAELVPRPDVAKKYPDAPVNTGWKIMIESRSLPDSTTVTVQLGPKTTLTYKVHKTT
jgi:hypothetical protein